MSTRDLETIFPQGQILDIGGQRIEIRPLVLGELPAMLRAIRPFASELSAEPDWLALLAEHGEALLRALAIASHRSDDWVASLELDDAITLGAAVFEVNAIFSCAGSPRKSAIWRSRSASDSAVVRCHRPANSCRASA